MLFTVQPFNSPLNISFLLVTLRKAKLKSTKFTKQYVENKIGHDEKILISAFA